MTSLSNSNVTPSPPTREQPSVSPITNNESSVNMNLLDSFDQVGNSATKTKTTEPKRSKSTPGGKNNAALASSRRKKEQNDMLRQKVEMAKNQKRIQFEKQLKSETPFKPKISARSMDMKKTPTTTSNELYQEAAERDEKKRAMAAQVQSHDTFQPEIHDYDFKNPRPSLIARYESVPKNTRKQRKAEIISAREPEEQPTFHPKINEYHSNKTKGPVHERLYNEAQQKVKNQLEKDELNQMKRKEIGNQPTINREMQPTNSFAKRLEESVKKYNKNRSDDQYNELHQQHARSASANPQVLVTKAPQPDMQYKPDYQECTFAPAINPRSQSLAKQEKNVYKHLYNKAKKNMDNAPIPDELSYKPKLNTKKTKELLQGNNENFEERQSRYVKKLLAHENKDDKDLRDCTFQPRVTHKYKVITTKNVYDRNFDADQDKKEKITKMQSDKEQEEISKCTFQPKVSKGANKLSGSSTVNVFDRLYNDSLEPVVYLLGESDPATYQPKITNYKLPPNSRGVFDRLFEDGQIAQQEREIAHEQRKMELEYQGNEECTFHPKIHSNTKVEIPIWKRTNEYTEMMENRQKAREAKYYKDCTFTPITNKTSIDPERGDLSTPIDYHRREEEKIKKEKKDCTFKPQLSKTKTTPKKSLPKAPSNPKPFPDPPKKVTNPPKKPVSTSTPSQKPVSASTPPPRPVEDYYDDPQHTFLPVEYGHSEPKITTPTQPQLVSSEPKITTPPQPQPVSSEPKITIPTQPQPVSSEPEITIPIQPRPVSLDPKIPANRADQLVIQDDLNSDLSDSDDDGVPANLAQRYDNNTVHNNDTLSDDDLNDSDYDI